jgi:hypothetical protein
MASGYSPLLHPVVIRLDVFNIFADEKNQQRQIRPARDLIADVIDRP